MCFIGIPACVILANLYLTDLVDLILCKLLNKLLTLFPLRDVKLYCLLLLYIIISDLHTSKCIIKS